VLLISERSKIETLSKNQESPEIDGAWGVLFSIWAIFGEGTNDTVFSFKDLLSETEIV
jgi:hypothetical protein